MRGSIELSEPRAKEAGEDIESLDDSVECWSGSDNILG